MFRVYYLGGANYNAARRHLGISEFTWADWADEIRRRVGRELTRAGVFPPSRYFRDLSERAS
jgi:transposase